MCTLPELRKSNNLSQQAVAEKLGVSVDTIRRLEQGKRIPLFTPKQWTILADAYNVGMVKLSDSFEKTFIKTVDNT